MKFMKNENLSGTVIHITRQHGHDVCFVKESLSEAPDEKVLRRAHAEQRVEALEAREDWAGHFAVVTHDRSRMRPLPPTGGGV